MIAMVKPNYMMFFVETEQGPELAAHRGRAAARSACWSMRRIMRLEF